MKLPLSFALALLPLLSHAATFKLKQVKQPRHSPALVPRQTPSDGQVAVGAGANAVNLTSAHDLVYLADITIAGVDYTVQLDTGSSDLWIKPPSVPLSGVTYTNHNINFTYSIGWANGTVAFAPVEFLGLPVASQAFLQVSTASNAVLSSAVGGDGVAGLGFTGRSGIDAVLNQTGVSTGRSLLYNLFMVHPDEPNFIAFALQRDHSGNATDVEGSFSIGEYDPAYAYVAGNERIPTFPVHNPHRWNVLLDALIINNPDNTNNILVPKSRLPYTPSNKAVVLLDSGASHTFCPPEMATALYGNITGAYFSESLGYWVVPCNTQINMALQIGGQIYPLNPLDVVTPTYGDQNTCIGTFIPSAPAESNEFDWLIGDNFLRNVYSVYDFGDFDENGKMGDPYIKLAATTDPEDASAEFAALMNSTARSIITYVGLQGAEVDPVFFVTKDISESLVLIGKLVPAMLGLVALNALVITVCAIFWLVSFLRKRRNRRTAREPRGRATPMQLTPRNSYIPGTPPPMPHVYEPVSMALTEDTFVPPSPAFRSKIQAGDRPKSVA